MGKALLEGWLRVGLPPAVLYVSEPNPSEWLQAQTKINLNCDFPECPDVVMIAVKPQLLTSILPGFARFANGSTTFVSIAAGAPIHQFEAHLGVDTPIIRAMPNLPASVGEGVTALLANSVAEQAQIDLTTSLFESVGSVVHLTEEAQLHAVTALSGSGPAYVFAMVEAMCQAGVKHGLPLELAEVLAKKTVAGAGAMLGKPGVNAKDLRVAVTSKGGTTEAALAILMATPGGLFDLANRTLTAAHYRSIELSKVHPSS